MPLLVAEAALQGRKMAGARRSSAAALVLVLLAMPASALAQARLTGADLEGLVRDESGGVLAGAVVTIVNAETAVARTIETGPDGRFRALALPPGSYSIRLDRAGFATENGSGIVLSSASPHRSNSR